MTTAAEFLQAARGEVGTTEDPPGSNKTKYAAEAGHANGQPWCASFVTAIARRCGIKLPSESAYTPAMANGFRAAGQWTLEPSVGAVAFFDFPDSKKRIQHVGIVESFTRDTVTCIEGNTSEGAKGSQDNGGGVYRRTRPRKHVVGFGLPAFAASTTPQLQEDDMPYPVLKIAADARLWLVTPNGVRQIPSPTVLKSLRAKKLAATVETEVSAAEFKLLSGVAP